MTRRCSLRDCMLMCIPLYEGWFSLYFDLLCEVILSNANIKGIMVCSKFHCTNIRWKNDLGLRESFDHVRLIITYSKIVEILTFGHTLVNVGMTKLDKILSVIWLVFGIILLLFSDYVPWLCWNRAYNVWTTIETLLGTYNYFLQMVLKHASLSY